MRQFCPRWWRSDERPAAVRLKDMFDAEDARRQQARAEEEKMRRAELAAKLAAPGLAERHYQSQYGPALVDGVECWPMVDGAGQSGTRIMTCGWPPNARVAYFTDWVSFLGCQGIHPVTGLPTGQDLIFAVDQNAMSDGGGCCELSLFSGLITEGPYRNIHLMPAHHALVGFIGRKPTPEFAELAIAMNR